MDWRSLTAALLAAALVASTAYLVPRYHHAANPLDSEVAQLTSEVAELLESSVAAVNSALQRARQTVQSRIPPITQQSTLQELGQHKQHALVMAYVAAWAADVLFGSIALVMMAQAQRR